MRLFVFGTKIFVDYQVAPAAPQPQQREQTKLQTTLPRVRGTDRGGDDAPAPAAGAIRYDVDAPTRLSTACLLTFCA
eukprot:879146-Pleurochrysis_carterae.AAC.2